MDRSGFVLNAPLGLTPVTSVTTITTGTSGHVLGYLDGANTISGACTYSAPQTPTAQTLTDAATVTIAITQQIWNLTLTAARIIGAPSGGIPGTTYRLVLTSAGFTPSWNTVFKFPGGIVPSSLTGTCIFDFYYDGTYFHCVGQNVGEA